MRRERDKTVSPTPSLAKVFIWSILLHISCYANHHQAYEKEQGFQGTYIRVLLISLLSYQSIHLEDETCAQESNPKSFKRSLLSAFLQVSVTEPESENWIPKLRHESFSSPKRSFLLVLNTSRERKGRNLFLQRWRAEKKMPLLAGLVWCWVNVSGPIFSTPWQMIPCFSLCTWSSFEMFCANERREEIYFCLDGRFERFLIWSLAFCITQIFFRFVRVLYFPFPFSWCWPPLFILVLRHRLSFCKYICSLSFTLSSFKKPGWKKEE